MSGQMTAGTVFIFFNKDEINIQWYQNWRTLHPTVHCSAVFAALVVQLPVEVRLGAEIIFVEGLNATCR